MGDVRVVTWITARIYRQTGLGVQTLEIIQSLPQEMTPTSFVLRD